MKNQKGVSLGGFLWVIVLLVPVLLFALKVGPSYLEFYTIKTDLKAVANDPGLKSPGEFKSGFQRRIDVDGITSISSDDLEVSKDGNQYVLGVSYAKKVAIVGNMSACMDFTGSVTR